MATVVATGGDGSFSYNWINDSQIGDTATGLSGGVHLIEITEIGEDCASQVESQTPTEN